MMKTNGTKWFGVVGGDLRSVSLANCLAENGYPVAAFAFDDSPSFHPSVSRQPDLSLLPQMDVVVFPLPVSSDSETLNAPFSEEKLPLSRCFSSIGKGACVLGGKVGPAAAKAAAQYGIEILDYLEREEFAVLNAVPAAEGALEITMNELATTIWDSSCLITGYGRIAKVLAKTLNAMGAKVTIAARKESDLAWAQIMGCQTVRLGQLKEAAAQQDIIYNTVPSVLFDQELLSGLKKDCLVIDLASKPGGVDFDIARELGIKTIWALSLPGKVAPITAGNIIQDTVINMISERGVLEK